MNPEIENNNKGMLKGENAIGKSEEVITANVLRERVSNFFASITCYVFMPLTPFVFEYFYSNPHQISKRSLMVAISTYSFSGAFGTNSRSMAIFLIFTGFLTGGMYGSVGKSEKANIYSWPSMILYILVILYLRQYWRRHVKMGEKCWFYSIFEQSQKSL